MEIRIRGNEVRFIYSDDWIDLLQEGQARIQRASHVEPGEGGWIADMRPVKGPVLGPFVKKDEALKAEVAWLYEHKIPVPE